MNDAKDHLTILTEYHEALDVTLRKLPPSKTKTILTIKRHRIGEVIRDIEAGVLLPIDIPDFTIDPPPGTGGGITVIPGTGPTPDLPPIEPPTFGRCLRRKRSARDTLAFQVNHWWQNWGKNQAYICQRMFFPLSVDQIGSAVAYAEEGEDTPVPVRAVGGGWSFSDVTLPGNVSAMSPWLALASPRPFALGVEALTKIVPLAKTFPSDPLDPIIAEIAQPPRTGPADGADSLVLHSPVVDGIETGFRYLGGGRWEIDKWAFHDRYVDHHLRLLLAILIETGGFLFSDDEVMSMMFDHGCRAVLPSSPDVAGSLAMFDNATGAFMLGFFYNGNGMWTSDVLGPAPMLRSFKDLAPTLPETAHPRASTAAWSMSLLSTPQRAFLINTESMASSLHQHFPDIASAEALRQTDPGTFEEPNPLVKHYFHVECGITMEALTELLSHQSPRLAIEASGGSPGATLAGALATATHGGEHNRPLLADRVKAIHLVGPGGVQWWIEGDESIADPDKLMEIYPCLARERIISGMAPVDGIRPQDWLNAIVVSMGCMGVVYSLVLEVVPLFGIHEVAMQSTWQAVLGEASFGFSTGGVRPVGLDALRSPPPGPTERAGLGDVLWDLFSDGGLTGIASADNRYVDIAIDPNPVGSTTLGERDWNCWVLNREVTATVPFEPKPPPKDMIGRIATSLGETTSPTAIADRLMDIFNVDFIRRLQDQDVPVDGAIRAVNQIQAHIPDVTRLLESSDTFDAALDLLTAPFESITDMAAASAIVSGLFAGLLGVEDGRGESTDVVTRVGAIGFPASGIMGTAIEIAMTPGDAFPFLQTEVLDRIGRPFFGYVSVRFCPQTQALLGMQQFRRTVMIELVAFGTQSARDFVAELERRTVAQIRGGLDAMLHWGLENKQLDGAALRRIASINTGPETKLAKFTTVRSLIRAAGRGGENVFDNAFTRRLEL